MTLNGDTKEEEQDKQPRIFFICFSLRSFTNKELIRKE